MKINEKKCSVVKNFVISFSRASLKEKLKENSVEKYCFVSISLSDLRLNPYPVAGVLVMGRLMAFIYQLAILSLA